MFDVTANYTHFEFMEMVYRGLYLEHKPIWLIETGLSRDQIKHLPLTFKLQLYSDLHTRQSANPNSFRHSILTFCQMNIIKYNLSF